MIDCDVHQNLKSIRDLLPYLPDVYREHIEHGGYAGVGFPEYHWSHPEGFWRRDSFPADGAPPGSSYELLRAQLLDNYDIDYAVLTGEDVLTASAMPNPYLAAALASSFNDWLIETWLPLDTRLKGSIAVATQDADRAADEIRRVGEHPAIVQVLLPSGNRSGYGDPHYHSIYDAASELDLVIGIHAGAGGCGTLGPPTATGWPTFYIEYHSLASTQMISHLTSLICHGTFEKFPQLRVVFIEGGVCWLPGVLWRLDQDYKGLRREVPWLKRLPSEYVRDHCRFTTQPLERPEDTRQLRSLLDLIGKEMLLFATDYPHWDFDDPMYLPIKDEWAERVFDRNAREWYRLPRDDTPHSPLAKRAVA